jgi:alginate O-acetyltransferase complex protein AlgI
VNSREALAGVSHLIRYLKEYGVLLLACILFATPYPARWYRKWKDKWFAVLILLVIFWLSVHEIIVGSNNPFLYFRF